MMNLTERFPSQIQELHSSLLPFDGTTHANDFYEDIYPRMITPLGPESIFPDMFSGEFFLACGTRPFFFHDIYNAGDCSNFVAMVTSLFSPSLMVEAQKIFPDIIRRFGFMPGVMNRGPKDDRAFTLDYSQMTWGPFGYWDQFAWSRDRAYLASFSDATATWAKWWLENRDRNNDGWIEAGVNDCKPSTPEFRAEMSKRFPEPGKSCPEYWDYTGVQNEQASAMNLMIFEIPWDDSPVHLRGRSRNLRFDPKTKSAAIHYIESQLYISLLCGYTAAAMRLRGKHQEAEFFTHHAERLKTLVRDHCWSEQTGFYHDRDIATGRLDTEVKHLGAFVAMFMGLPTVEQARRMVNHLTNPDEFWTAYPAPTISRDSADYHPTHYWSGRAWPPTNFFVLKALLNYGYFDVADEFLRRWMRLMQTCIDRKPDTESTDSALDGNIDARRSFAGGAKWIVPENWHPETGAVIGSGGTSWGGLWLPAVVYRHFWPVGEYHVLLRSGGEFRFRWSDRWDVQIQDCTAQINGRSYTLESDTTFLLNETTDEIIPLEPGLADPVQLGFGTQTSTTSPL
ncbi:MAG: hypothetical protein JXA11_16140 [Phycisphaerae bacterium]|nr:hypothetical protein [Phycisphaerae bacterium]